MDVFNSHKDNPAGRVLAANFGGRVLDLESEFAEMRAWRALIAQRLDKAVRTVVARQAGRRKLPRPACCMFILTREEAIEAAGFEAARADLTT